MVWLGYDDNRETGLTGSSGALRVWTDIMNRLDVQRRQLVAPADISWQRVAALPARAESVRNSRSCESPLMLPFREGQAPTPAVDCENSGSLIERVFDRFRNL